MRAQRRQTQGGRTDLPGGANGSLQQTLSARARLDLVQVLRKVVWDGVCSVHRRYAQERMTAARGLSDAISDAQNR